MKILHIDPDDIDNPLSGGGPIRTYEIYRRLTCRHDITVLTPTFEGSTPEIIRDGVRYIRLGRKIGDHGSSHHITFFFSLPMAIRKMEYDLLVEDFMPPMSITFNPLFVKKPIIASVQWFSAQELSRTYKLPFFLGERYGIKLYNHFIVLTEAMKKLITSRHKTAQCEVIPNGVDESLLDSEIRSGDYILYLGLVDFGGKGVDLLLNSYKLVPEQMRLPLILAGHGYQWDKLNSMISQLGLARWVKAVGRVDAAEKARLFSGCRFVCFPSRNETFGMVILEACASGKPVVLFDRAPMNEVASPACRLVEAFNIAAYSEAMLSLIVMGDKELVEKGIDCRYWARNYSWSALALRQEQFYQKVYQEESRS